MSEEEVKRKVALITGITGQDGSYLAELLLSKGYEVRRERQSCLCVCSKAHSDNENVVVRIECF